MKAVELRIGAGRKGRPGLRFGLANKPSRKGMSSSRVRSAPRARAMVERRWMAFRRSKTSSCCNKGQLVEVGKGIHPKQKKAWARTAVGPSDRPTFNSSISTAMG